MKTLEYFPPLPSPPVLLNVKLIRERCSLLLPFSSFDTCREAGRQAGRQVENKGNINDGCLMPPLEQALPIPSLVVLAQLETGCFCFGCKYSRNVHNPPPWAAVESLFLVGSIVIFCTLHGDWAAPLYSS